MGQYTVLDDPAAEAAVQEQLDRITAGIRNALGEQLRAIVLTGSFGRGEGGVIRKDGRYRPVNDFDIGVLVSAPDYFLRRKQLQARLQQAADELAPQVGVKQIDVGISHALSFRLAPNLVNWYEIRNGHRVLWGDVDLKKLMPALPAHRLPLLDGAIYFLSRGSGLLIPALYFLPDREIAERQRENFQLEVSKACLAMGDALLLLRKRYHFSYAERQRRMRKVDLHDVPQGETLRIWYLEAVERKLFPSFDWPGDEQMAQRWFDVRDLFGEFFLWFESQRLKQAFANWGAYSGYVQQHVRDPWGDRVRRWLKGGVRTQKGGIPRGSKRFNWAVTPTLLFSLTQNGIHGDLLAEGRKLLRLPQRAAGVQSWMEATRVYLGVFHPHGVVSELLEERR